MSSAHCSSVVCTLPLLCFSVPPEVSVEGTSTPAVEYTERNITCRTSGGNPSDPRCYTYDWMYKPANGASSKYIPVPMGMF